LAPTNPGQSPEEIEKRKREREEREQREQREQEERKRKREQEEKNRQIGTIVGLTILSLFLGAAALNFGNYLWRLREEDRHRESGEETFKQAYKLFLDNFYNDNRAPNKKAPTKEEFSQGLMDAFEELVLANPNKIVHAIEREEFDVLVKHFGGMTDLHEKWNRFLEPELWKTKEDITPHEFRALTRRHEFTVHPT
jgi:hypothetical protein